MACSDSVNQIDSHKISVSTDAIESGVSTAATGPAGSHFEGQVGAFYLLAMLSSAPPRGLPGTTIDCVALQQANTGRPLDDVIVHAHDSSGNNAILEIQVKHAVTFAPTDPVFKKIVGQIVNASQRDDFLNTRYELAIATAKGSHKIDGAYQRVLTLARQIGDAATFMAQIALAGVANDDMRAFVNTFRSHLREEGAPDDETATWQLLGRLQILTFDFAAPGSVSAELAHERAAHVLHSDDASKAGALWKNLVELAIDIAKSGGDRTRETLLPSLLPLGFRFVGERRHTSARAALAEASKQALADIRHYVGKVVLARQERIAAVNDALDKGRYVEIRGDAGVGKSGVLRHLAEQLGIEGHIIVLSPGRCVPRGWHAMRGQLGFDGTLHDLLVELANDGGAVLFIDNLDFFGEEEKTTVVDIVREAAEVSGISIVATARPGFGIEEPSWLPSDTLDRLGRAEPIVIDGLSEAEIEQLEIGDPALAPLLIDSHPARQVTRNLFRLARLASQPSTLPLPRTEVDMAEQWWNAADGPRDSGWRDRIRLLQEAAEQSLMRVDFLDVRNRAAEPIDALVASGTFRELGIDRVAFRHDVLREWAIANALHANVSLLDRLNLERPAPAMLARGIELTARMAIERAADGAAWYALVERLSRTGAHLSWRRAALLALVRSEAKEVLLQRASPELLGNHATLLRELIRTVLAVEVVPASTVFAAAGVDPALIPDSLHVPRGLGWPALVIWLLSLGDRTPVLAIPEIVELYTAFSVGTLGATAITPITTRCLYKWLRLMEPLEATPMSRDGPVFWHHLQREQIQSLKTDLRNGFLMFARTTPDLAAEYLSAVARSEHNDNLVRSILKMRGTLALAAPAELAHLTEQSLIEEPRPSEQYYGREREEPFTFLDSEFLPASPAQGPFFELLVNSPKTGLALVHRLVDHALAHGSGGRAPGSDVIVLAFPGGSRSFPWTQTYFWSRNSHYYCVTSALMALEAWAHRRIEAGESFETVLEDVLGPENSTTAYLLVAVDLIISHWPKSVEAAPAFLACPELLCLDHTRQVHDSIATPDLFGFGALRSEPRGAVSMAELKRRASRRNTLDALIGNYVLMVSVERRDELVALLREAAARLGPPGAEANLRHPEFMIQYALNLADVGNWHDVDVTLQDGSVVTACQYVAPDVERDHLQALRDAAAEASSDFAMQSAITRATEDPSVLSPEARSAAMAWARRASVLSSPEMEDDDVSSLSMRRDAVLTAAMIVMRDGDDTLRAEHGEWAREQLEEELRTLDSDPVHQVRAGLHFNRTAIAYVGLVHALRHHQTANEVRILLELAAHGNHAAAHGFGAAVTVLEAIDVRLPCALIRCAFSACILPNREWNTSEEELKAQGEQRSRRAKAAVAAEMTWLAGEALEPKWPSFPQEPVRRRRRLRVPVGLVASEAATEVEPESPSEHVNHQAAALWLRHTSGLLKPNALVWLRHVVEAYMVWTTVVNGAGMENSDEIDLSPYEWNDAFFTVVARCIRGLTFDEIEKLAITSIVALPDRHFFDLLAIFLRGVDEIYFEGGDIQTPIAVSIRSALAARMMDSRGWKRLDRSKEMSIEMHIGPAIATLFFNNYLIGRGTKCYLYEKGVERIPPFLPVLGRLAQSAPSPFVALVLLNLLEVSPRPAHLDILVEAGKVWLDAYSDFRQFWIDHSFGRRWCLMVDSIRTQAPAAMDSNLPIRLAVDSILAALVGLGVPEASRLEESLSRQ
jgi:hypothetical protein